MKGPLTEEQRLLKMEESPFKRVTVTTRIKGTLKKEFFRDSIKRDLKEAKLAECIFKIHYAIVSQYPALGEFDYTDIRKMDAEKLKECIVKVMSAK
jgi:hypothetical protein